MQKLTIVCGVAFAMLSTAQAKPGALVTAVGDLKWTDVPNLPGAHMAVADGDPKKGPSHFFVKFDKGFSSGDHHHTSDHYSTVVSGTLLLTVDGKESKLGPGSYFSFTGKKPHSAKCDPAADCILAMDVRGAWDVIPEKAPAKPTK